MQPSEQYNVSRRALDVEDYIDILRRHKGWIFGPFLFTLVISVVGGYLWPDTFVSRGVIKVEPRMVPENLVQVTMTQDMMDRINSMMESIESRSKLIEIIQTYNLYLKERNREPIEDVVELMKSQIHVEALGANQGAGHKVPAFSVSFAYTDRHQAQKVVTELISRFIDEYTHNGANLTYQSTSLMTDLAQSSQKELEAIEERLAAYKIENNGRLPEQVGVNYQKLQSLETSASSLTSQINHYEQEKLILVQGLNQYKHQLDVIANIKVDPVAATQQPKSTKLLRAEAEVESYANQLQALQQLYNDNFPSVKNTRESLKKAEDRRDAIIAEEAAQKKDIAAGKPSESPAAVKEQLDRDSQISRTENQIAADDNQIEDLKGQQKLVNQQIAALNGRLNAVPQSEKDYDDLVRERDLKKTQYEEMTKHLAQAKVSQEVENRKQGENLEILDGASLPESATYPNHPLIIAVGAGIGLLLGIVIAGAREMKDTSLKNLKDVRAYTQMAILGSIPLLENDFVVRRRRRLAWLGWTTACLAALVLMVGSVVYYISTKQ